MPPAIGGAPIGPPGAAPYPLPAAAAGGGCATVADAVGVNIARGCTACCCCWLLAEAAGIAGVNAPGTAAGTCCAGGAAGTAGVNVA
jgi:hypothetical protein